VAEIIEIDAPGAAAQVGITETFDELIRVRWSQGSTVRRDVVISIDQAEDCELEITPNYGTMRTTPALIQLPKASTTTGNTFVWTAAPDRDGCMPVVQLRVRTLEAPGATTQVSVSAS